MRAQTAQYVYAVVFFFGIAISPVRADALFFSAIPLQEPKREKVLYSVVADKLGKTLGMPVDFRVSNDYQHTLSMFRDGDIDLAWVGGVTGLLARRADPEARAIVKGFEDQFFQSLLIANHKTGLKPQQAIPEEIRGLSMVMASPLSTSGRVMPEYLLHQHFGQPIREVFSEIGLSGTHERTIQWVAAGKYQLGAVDFRVWYSMLQERRFDASLVHVVWQSPYFPDYHFIVRGDTEKKFGKGFVSKLQSALLAMNGDGRVMNIFRRSHFLEAGNRDFAEIERAAKFLGLLE